MRSEVALIDRLPGNEDEARVKIKKVIDIFQIVKELDLLEKDMIVKTLIVELSKTPDNEAILGELNRRLKPHLIQNEINPPMFKIPSEE